jgi:hypothetical protein
LGDLFLAQLSAALAPDSQLDKGLPDDYEGWLSALFPAYVSNPFGPHHHDLWRWLWAIERRKPTRPFVAVWPRGGGKSTSSELATIALGARGIRRYCLYVCCTQKQADDHVQTIATILESPIIARYYPTMTTRMVGRYGQVRGWSRTRLRTAAGFTIDALGLDVAVRGVKLDEQRPDALILDDLDQEGDSQAESDRKVIAFTRKLLPACTADAAILAVQNVVKEDGLFGRMAGRSNYKIDWMSDRIVSGPFPALDDFAWETKEGQTTITSGIPIWDGQGLVECQAFINRWGLLAFRTECQHETGVADGGIFSHIEFAHCTPDAVPPLIKTVVAIDPAVTDTDKSDAHGIQIDGIDAKRRLYRLFSWEQRASPDVTLKTAMLKALEYKASEIIVETDQGGDLWQGAYDTAWKSLVQDRLVPVRDANLHQKDKDGRPLPEKLVATVPRPTFRPEKAGAGHGPKVHRAQLMLEDYDNDMITHVLGTHVTLERALRRFPAEKPFDLTDAAYWSWRRLRRGGVGFA